MGVTPQSGGDLAEALAKTYQDAELTILKAIVRKLMRGIELPDWEQQQLANAQALRAEFVKDLARYNATAAAQIDEAVSAAYGVGAAGAVADLSEVVDKLAAVNSYQRRAAVARLTAEATGKLAESGPQILRLVSDRYQEVVSRSASLVLTNGLTTKQAVQQGVTELLSNGITGITDKAGRRYNLSDYVQMATRTATAHAVLAGHDDTMMANGEDLCVIQPGPRPCDICDPFASQILSISGLSAGDIVIKSWHNGESITVHVDGSLAEARAKGWGHPNCRCGKKGYFAGVTKLPPRRSWDQKGYEAQQKQRAIERSIRKDKTAAALAVTPEEEAKANARVRAGQARLRDHLKSNPALKRQSDREQIGAGETGFERPIPSRGTKPKDPRDFPFSKEAIPEFRGDDNETGIANAYTRQVYDMFNGFKRDPESYYARNPDQAAILKEDTDILETALRRTKTTAPTRLTRRVKADAFGLDSPSAESLQGLVGTDYVDKAFTSTRFGDDNNALGGAFVNLRILAPEGTPGANVSLDSFFRSEQEFLLPPGTKFHVESYESIGDGEGKKHWLTVSITN